MIAVLATLACVACAGEDVPINEPVDPNDLDGDGIPNAEDLCPRSAGVPQHDEDGDGVGDACDVCPMLPDPLQGDTGERSALQFEDGVGDACDPRPGSSGDIEEAFFAFTDPRHVHGTGWTLADDALHATGDARWGLSGLTGDGLYAQIRVGTLAWLGPGRVTVGVDGSATDLGATCSVVRDRNGDNSDELEITVNAVTETRELGGRPLGDFTIAMWRAIDRHRVGFAFCRFRVGAMQRELLVMTDDTATGHYGFATTGADVRIAAAIAYSFPINPCAQLARCPDDMPDP